MRSDKDFIAFKGQVRGLFVVVTEVWRALKSSGGSRFRLFLLPYTVTLKLADFIPTGHLLTQAECHSDLGDYLSHRLVSSVGRPGWAIHNTCVHPCVWINNSPDKHIHKKY